MKILHISSTDLAGGRFNGYYMNEYFQNNHFSEMAVWNKKSNNSNVHTIPPHGRVGRFFADSVMRIGSRLGFDGIAGSGGWLLPHYDFFKQADIIHLHLIHGFSNFSILSLPKMSRLKPIVWTIHDPWASTGGCEHSFECNKWLTGCAPRCPYPRCRSIFKSYTPFLHWKIKKRIYHNSEITLIVASKWMKDRISQSPLLGHLPCHQIPFGIDLELFRPRSKQDCRSIFGIPLDHKVIAFRDIAIFNDKFKGMQWLMQALKYLEPSTPTTLLIFENGTNFKTLSNKYNIITTGWIEGDNLATALSASDIFVMPSIQESFGLMAVEAMACGTPVIVFDGTALPDIIKAPLGGVVVQAKDSTGLAKAIEFLLDNNEIRSKMSITCRNVAESEYSFSTYLKDHLNIYEDCIKQFNG